MEWQSVKDSCLLLQPIAKQINNKLVSCAVQETMLSFSKYKHTPESIAMSSSTISVHNCSKSQVKLGKYRFIFQGLTGYSRLTIIELMNTVKLLMFCLLNVYRPISFFMELALGRGILLSCSCHQVAHTMMIDVLRPVLCTWLAKWAERPLEVMKRSQRWNNLQICPRRDSNTGGSDQWSNTLPLDHGGAPR